MNQSRTKASLVHTITNYCKRKLESQLRYESFCVEIVITIPVLKTMFGNERIISTKNKTARLRFDRREKVWQFWVHRKYLISVIPEPEYTEKILTVLRPAWTLLEHPYVLFVENERRNQAEIIKLHMPIDDLLKRKIA